MSDEKTETHEIEDIDRQANQQEAQFGPVVYVLSRTRSKPDMYQQVRVTGCARVALVSPKQGNPNTGQMPRVGILLDFENHEPMGNVEVLFLRLKDPITKVFEKFYAVPGTLPAIDRDFKVEKLKENAKPVVDKPAARRPGRPRKTQAAKKRGPGRPRKVAAEVTASVDAV